MSLKLYQRNGIWNYRGTIGPTGHRSRLRGSCNTKDKDTAARQISEIEGNYWKGHFDGPSSILTFRRAALNYRAAGKSGRFLEPIEGYLKDMPVKAITAGTIRAMALELFPGCTGATLNRCGIVPAQAVINYAAESELCPPIKVKRFKFDAKRKHPVTVEWLKKFEAQASTDAMKALPWFMFLTGARVGEAVGLQWDDIDFKVKTAVIRETKVGTERTAHLPDTLVVRLANLPRIEGRGVFGYKHPDDLMNAWRAITKRAEIKRLTPHSCRHGFATELLHAGYDVVTVAYLGGWKTAALVLSTYGHAIKDRTLTDVLTKNEHVDANDVTKTLMRLVKND